MRNIRTSTFGWSGAATNEDVARVLSALRWVRTVRRMSVTRSRIQITYDADEVSPAHFQRAMSRAGAFRLLAALPEPANDRGPVRERVS